MLLLLPLLPPPPWLYWCYFHRTSAQCVQIDAEKSPFLVEKLKIWMLPTLACVKQVHPGPM